MLYFDSSYLFRLYSQERGHLVVKHLPVGHDQVASAIHARAEFATIVLRHRREQAAPAGMLKELHEQFLDECRAGRIRLLPLSEAVFGRIEAVLRAAPHSTFLRAADALHLACAAENGFTEVYSNDRHFLAAAPLFGLCGVDVIAGV
jgi:predicted nucleic acid-binding protein